MEAVPLPAPEEQHPPPLPRPREVHRPRIVDVEVTAVLPDKTEVKLADGRLGAISASDFHGRSPSPGEHIRAALLERSDPKRVWLSYAWAQKSETYDRLSAAREAHEVLRGQVLRVVRGGAVVEVEGQRAFMPASLAEERPIDLETLVGTEIEVTVIDLDESADRIVVSHRDAVRRQRRAEQREVLGSLTIGQIAAGVIVGIRDFGAQVDLGGGVRGLIHRSELGWGRVGAVSEFVTIGDRVEALVIEVHKGKRRVALSMRRMTPDPLADLDVGRVTEAEILRVVEYGAFARLLDCHAEGLIHLTELSELPGSRPDELVAPGDVVHVKVIDLDRERRRLGLSIKQALLS